MNERTLIKILKELSTECPKYKGHSWQIRLAQVLVDEYNLNANDVATIQYKDHIGEEAD